jgi:voltage-gated potassium channel
MPIFQTISRRLRGLARVRGRETARRVLALIAVAIVIVLVGAALFAITQHDDYWTALYWAITTATTVGYGDVLPHNAIGRVIASFVMLTTIPIVGAVFSLVAGASAVTHLRRILGMETHLPKSPYTLIYGDHPVVDRVLEELREGDEPVVVVTPRPAPNLHEDALVVTGDPTDERVIARSRPENASRVLIACNDDADTLVLAVSLHARAPKVKTYALTHSSRVASALKELGVSHTLAAEELLGHTIAKSLETPEAGDLLLQIVDATSYRLTERTVDASLASRTLSSVRADPDSLVLGIARDGGVDLGIGDDPTLQTGDRLIVLNALPA